MSRTTAAEAIDFLTYRSYKFNRETSPHVPVSGWEFVFGEIADIPAFEARYQMELATLGLRIVERAISHLYAYPMSERDAAQSILQASVNMLEKAVYGERVFPAITEQRMRELENADLEWRSRA